MDYHYINIYPPQLKPWLDRIKYPLWTKVEDPVQNLYQKAIDYSQLVEGAAKEVLAEPSWTISWAEGKLAGAILDTSSLIGNVAGTLMGEIDVLTNNLVDALEIGFNDVYQEIDSIEKVINTDLLETIPGFTDLPTAIADYIYTPLDERITVLESMPQGVSGVTQSEMESYVDKEIALVEKPAATIINNIDNSVGDITYPVTEITNNITETVKYDATPLYTAINQAESDLESKLSTLETDIKLEISDIETVTQNNLIAAVTSLLFNIKEVHTNLQTEIDKLELSFEGKLSEAKIDLQGKIDNLQISFEDEIEVVLEPINDQLKTIGQLSDWRYQFFTIFLEIPELSVLQVLNRDDATFNKWKPYWQALFVRTLSET